MDKFSKGLLIGVIISIFLSMQVYGYSSREITMAKRAAKYDAYRLLIEHVNGFQLDSEGNFFVSDIISQSLAIRTEFKNVLIKGAKVVRYRDLGNGLYAADVKITLQKIKIWLESVYNHRLPKEERLKINFKGLEAYPEVITATGYGAIPGTPGEEKFKAYRAAVLDAYNNLAETVLGLHISSETSVRDLALDVDSLHTELSKWFKGAKITSVSWGTDNECKVKAEVTLREIIAKLKNLHRHRGLFGHKDYRWEDIKLYTKDTVVSAEGEGFPTQHVEESERFPSVTKGEPTGQIGGKKWVIEEKPVVR